MLNCKQSMIQKPKLKNTNKKILNTCCVDLKESHEPYAPHTHTASCEPYECICCPFGQHLFKRILCSCSKIYKTE
jgi:hypothetical protein